MTIIGLCIRDALSILKYGTIGALIGVVAITFGSAFAKTAAMTLNHYTHSASHGTRMLAGRATPSHMPRWPLIRR